MTFVASILISIAGMSTALLMALGAGLENSPRAFVMAFALAALSVGNAIHLGTLL
jgi:hypothetical protein